MSTDDRTSPASAESVLRKRQEAKDAETIANATAPTESQVMLRVSEERLRLQAVARRLRALSRDAQRTGFTDAGRQAVHRTLTSLREAVEMLAVVVDSEPITDESLRAWMDGGTDATT